MYKVYDKVWVIYDHKAIEVVVCRVESEMVGESLSGGEVEIAYTVTREDWIKTKT